MIPLQLDGLAGDPLTPVVAIGGVLALVLGVLGRIWIDRRRSPRPAPVDTFEEPEPEDVEEEAPAPEEPPPPLLAKAASRFSAGEFTGTVQAAYMHTRNHLATEHDLEAAGTHWDFFSRCEERGPDDGVAALRELTTLYERAVFGSETIDRENAERALDLSVSLTGDSIPAERSEHRSRRRSDMARR